MKKICVTGANGFIGSYLCKALKLSDKSFLGFVRDNSIYSSKIDTISVGDIASVTNWSDYLKGCDCIVHCAGKAHIMKEKKNHNSYRLINTESTRLLAEQAAKVGVKKFIFLSTIKVNGENSDNINDRKIFTNSDLPDPKDEYSKSKFEAEKLLWEISAKTGLDVVILRLPLVYGNGVKGNLSRLMKLVNLGIPLPFSSIDNKRSLIGIDNLIDVLIRCIDNSEAAGKTFLVSDDEDISTPQILKYISAYSERTLNLFPMPKLLLKFFGILLGRQKEIDRLIGSLKIDISYTKAVLNWSPPISVEEGIRRMVQKKK